MIVLRRNIKLLIVIIVVAVGGAVGLGALWINLNFIEQSEEERLKQDCIKLKQSVRDMLGFKSVCGKITGNVTQ